MPSRAERTLFRHLRATCERHNLLEPGDHVLVAISGGKDSYVLLDLLCGLQRQAQDAGKGFELTAVHLDQVQPGYDGQPLVDWLRAWGGRFEILREDTYAVVQEKLRPDATPCSLCSRLRRGVLYTAAERLGCNKIALGHHRDDALETFMMNLFFSGQLKSMPARYRTDCGRFDVIRPLIDCAQPLIRTLATERAFPILDCNVCGSQEGLMREEMGGLLDTLEERHSNVRSVMMAALGNVRGSHLLDPHLQEIWQPKPVSERDSRPATKRHARALPVLSSDERC